MSRGNKSTDADKAINIALVVVLLLNFSFHQCEWIMTELGGQILFRERIITTSACRHRLAEWKMKDGSDNTRLDIIWSSPYQMSVCPSIRLAISLLTRQYQSVWWTTSTTDSPVFVYAKCRRIWSTVLTKTKRFQNFQFKRQWPC